MQRKIRSRRIFLDEPIPGFVAADTFAGMPKPNSTGQALKRSSSKTLDCVLEVFPTTPVVDLLAKFVEAVSSVSTMGLVQRLQQY